jgi:hypothetical protein
MDHDQRFKHLIQVFFLEFLELFFKNWAERLDGAKVEWLDKEVFIDPPEGERRILDLVGKLPTKAAVPGQRPGETESWLALVHIEIESPDRVAPLRSRMFDAYWQLRRKHRLPVLPIGLYLQVGLDGIGVDCFEEYFWELRTVRSEYLYVGLPGLDAIEYVQGANWLGAALAALMRIPKDKVAWLGGPAAPHGSTPIGAKAVPARRMRAGLPAAGCGAAARIPTAGGDGALQRSTGNEYDIVRKGQTCHYP